MNEAIQTNGGRPLSVSDRYLSPRATKSGSNASHKVNIHFIFSHLKVSHLVLHW
jgi:hypothetical protein